MKVLLIEDDSAVAQLIKEMLEAVSKDGRRGTFNVHGENTLKKGIDYLKQDSTDIVLLDLSLPDSKGFNTLSAVRREAVYIPVVILTGLDDTELAVKALQYGAQDYLIKSEVEPALLARAVQYAIERSRIEKAVIKSRDELEERVKERTAELFKTNELLKKEIEERKKKEKELQEAYVKLKEAQSQLIQAAKLQVVGTLASGVAHEVKNPLAIILQGVEFISKRINTKDKDVNMAAASIKEAVERADRIIKGLLDFSSVSNLNMQKANINLLIEKCVFLLKNEFDRRHIRVIKNFGEVPYVSIDRNKIEQVFINIFMNAAYAMEDSGGELTIDTFLINLGRTVPNETLREGTVSPERKNTLAVEVTDTGRGIPKDIIERVFDPFFTTKRSRGGTGLGLAIVKNIIDMHKGEISIDNIKGKGARVRIYFPVY